MKTTALSGDGNPYAVPGLERGLAILRTFTRERPEHTAPELAASLGLPRATVHRLLRTLEDQGCLERAEDGRSYRLGVGVLRLGFEYLAAQNVVERGRPLIERLCAATNTPAHLVVRDGDAIVYVARAAPPSVLVGTVSVGTRLPAHATVLGRVLMSDFSLAQLKQLFGDARLPSSTRQTPTSIKQLNGLITADRERGFGISEGFYEHGISTIAAPVRNRAEQVVAAVGLTVTAPSISMELIRAGAAEKTVETAAGLAQLLDYRGSAYQRALVNAGTFRRDRERAV